MALGLLRILRLIIHTAKHVVQACIPGLFIQQPVEQLKRRLSALLMGQSHRFVKLLFNPKYLFHFYFRKAAAPHQAKQAKQPDQKLNILILLFLRHRLIPSEKFFISNPITEAIAASR